MIDTQIGYEVLPASPHPGHGNPARPSQQERDRRDGVYRPERRKKLDKKLEENGKVCGELVDLVQVRESRGVP